MSQANQLKYLVSGNLKGEQSFVSVCVCFRCLFSNWIGIVIRQGKEEPNPAAKTKDKFLVLTIPVEKVESDEDFPTLWAKFEKESEVLISRKKIRVQYEFGTNGTTHQPSDTSVENVGNESEANTSHTLEDHDTTILMSEPTSGIPSSPPAYENTRSGEPKVSVVEQPDVKEELQQAREKISTMSKELKTPSAKPSGINPLANIAPPTTAVRPSSGIPISLTLIIALIAFYIGWRFA